MRRESLIWVCKRFRFSTLLYSPTCGGRSPSHWTLSDRQPTLLVLKAIRLCNGFQAQEKSVVSSTLSLLQLIPLFKSQTRKVPIRPFQTLCFATKHWKIINIVFPTFPNIFKKAWFPMEIYTGQVNRTSPECTEALMTNWRVLLTILGAVTQTY